MNDSIQNGDLMQYVRIFWMIVIIGFFSMQNYGAECIVSREKQPINLIVSSHLGAGFFSELAKVVGAIIHFEEEGIGHVFVDWRDEFFPYKDAPNGNGWDLYFEPIAGNYSACDDAVTKIVSGGTLHEIHDQNCSSAWLSYDQFLPYRLFVHETIKRYVHIKKDIIDEVDLFYSKKMQGFVCIGVHVRFANAHINEVPGQRHASLEEYFKEVDEIIKRENRSARIKIYIASDSHYVVNCFKERYGAKIVCIDAHRASHAEDPGLIFENAAYWLSHKHEWHQRKPGYKGGRTALMDCLLLAKCDYIVHGTSHVANFVTFFNPTIKSVYLPRSAPYVVCYHKHDLNVHNKYLNPI